MLQDGAMPRLQQEVSAAIAGKAVRLAKISTERAVNTHTPPRLDGRALRELSVEQVFAMLWRDRHGDEAPDAEVLGCLNELVDDVRQQGGT